MTHAVPIPFGGHAQVFDRTSMEEISRKQFLLTGYLEALIKMHFTSWRNGSGDLEAGALMTATLPHDLPHISILTPSDPKQRGSQLSITLSLSLCAVQEQLKKRGIVVRDMTRESDHGARCVLVSLASLVSLSLIDCTVRCAETMCPSCGASTSLQLLL